MNIARRLTLLPSSRNTALIFAEGTNGITAA